MRSNTTAGRNLSQALWAGVRRSAGRAAHVILPPNCLICDQAVDAQGVVCAGCWKKVDFIERPFCEVMGSPFSYELGAGALSAEAIANPPPFERHRSVALYRGPVVQLVSSLKFADRVDLAPWMASWMVRSSDDLLDAQPIVIPVPLHGRRLFSRRFNQSAELARSLCKQTGSIYRPDVLKRVRATKQQVGLGVKERFRNVSGAFRVPEDARIVVQGRRVVIVDDVYTTGATIAACARAIKRAGAAGVDCLTFARVAQGEE